MDGPAGTLPGPSLALHLRGLPYIMLAWRQHVLGVLRKPRASNSEQSRRFAHQLIGSAHTIGSQPDRDGNVHFRRALVARDSWRASSPRRGEIRRDRRGHVLHGLCHELLMARKLYSVCPFSSGTLAHALLKASSGLKRVDVTTSGLQPPFKQYSGRPAARRDGTANAVRHACRLQLSGGGELCCPLSAPLWSINGYSPDQIPTSHSDVPQSPLVGLPKTAPPLPASHHNMYATSPFRQAQPPWWRAIWPAVQHGTKFEISANRDMPSMLHSHMRAPAAGFLDAYPSCGTRAPESTEPGFKQMLAYGSIHHLGFSLPRSSAVPAVASSRNASRVALGNDNSSPGAGEEPRMGFRVSWALTPSPLALNRQASSSGWAGDAPSEARGEPPGPLEDRSTMDLLASLSGALTPASEVSHPLISSPPALNELALSFFRYAEFATKNVRDSMICLLAAYQEMTESILPGAWTPKPADSSPPAA
ncbi:hypothetical protein LTS09_002767 [Friedmanniomyces endolithicus]|nr:hypothetical protein LTS09_002767 [Friedmanniomyces endolithicus]